MVNNDTRESYAMETLSWIDGLFEEIKKNPNEYLEHIPETATTVLYLLDEAFSYNNNTYMAYAVTWGEIVRRCALNDIIEQQWQQLYEYFKKLDTPTNSYEQLIQDYKIGKNLIDIFTYSKTPSNKELYLFGTGLYKGATGKKLPWR